MEIKINRYKIAVEQVRHEANLSWQNFRTYLIIHAILLAFLLRSAFNQDSDSHIGLIIICLFGILLCIPWRATSKRNSKYHSFRMARELEPDEWNFLRGKGQEFAEGGEVEVDGNKYQIPWMGRVLRRPVAAQFIVWGLVAVYLLIIFKSLFLPCT